jgi:hypothetical protein
VALDTCRHGDVFLFPKNVTALDCAVAGIARHAGPLVFRFATTPRFPVWKRIARSYCKWHSCLDFNAGEGKTLIEPS